jgi:hypothetical protein
MRREVMLFVVALILVGRCFASPITWTLQNAVFADGGAATGFFVFDPDTTCNGCIPAFANWDISTFGGNTSVFFPFEFTPANSFAVWGPSFNGDEGIIFDSNQLFPNNLPPPLNFNEALSLRIIPVSYLTDAGGTINMDLSNLYQGECFNCNPFRFFISGSVASTPEPRSLSLALLAILGCAGFLWRRTRSGATEDAK